MSKVKESYYEQQQRDRESLPCGRIPANRPRERKPKPQIEGQIELAELYPEMVSRGLSEDQKLDAIEQKRRKAEAERAELRKRNKLAYYDAFHNMLNKHGSLLETQPLLDAVDSGNWTEDVRNAVNNIYKGSIDELRAANHRREMVLRNACKKFREAAEADGVNLFGVRGQDDAYYVKERRNKYRAIIKREKGRIERGKDVSVYSPEDMEAEYQTWRAAKESKSKGS